MTYSCVDFTDSILNALKIEVPEEHWDNPSGQADLALAEIERLQGIESKAWLLVAHSEEELYDLIDWLHGHPSDEEMVEEDLPVETRVRLNAWLLRLAGAQETDSYPSFAAVPPALARVLAMVIEDWSEVEGSHDVEFNTTLIEQEG